MVDANVGIVAALGSSASWAVGSILFAGLGKRLRPVGLTLAKGAISVALLAVVLAVSKPVAPIPPRSLNLLILSGILGIAVGDTLFFAALQRLGASVLVLLFALGQALTVILAVLRLGERPNSIQLSGIVVITASVAAVLWLRSERDNRRTELAGLLYGLGSIVSMSVSLILAKVGLGEAAPLHATFIRMVAGVVCVGFWMLITGQIGTGLKPMLDPDFVAKLTVAVAVVTFGGFWLSLVAVKNIDVAVANTLTSTEPIFVLPLAAIYLRERVTVPQVLCAFATVMGVALLSLSQ
jgi:drug/metabolite transporter (DMT)-like permease